MNVRWIGLLLALIFLVGCDDYGWFREGKYVNGRYIMGPEETKRWEDKQRCIDKYGEEYCTYKTKKKRQAEYWFGK